MPWKDAGALESKLSGALNEFDWHKSEEICQTVVDRIRTDPDQIPEASAKRLLNGLRRKRRFQQMTQLAEAVLQSGVRTPQVRRQYAQALIDQGNLSAGEMVLQTIINEHAYVENEELEARGLTGRVYKQIYINNNDPASPRNRQNLERAIGEYLFAYNHGPEHCLWQGINVVALSDRAYRDGIKLIGLPKTEILAEEILNRLQDKEQRSGGQLPAYDVATELESYVALGETDKAADVALRYVNLVDADAFEIRSTLRQLTEVWQLNYEDGPGKLLLPILRAGHLRQEGASIARDPTKLAAEVAGIENSIDYLEANFGTEKTVTLRWFKQGLEQCYAVARIERRDGTGHGTGWLVKASDFFAGEDGLMLITNGHVVSDKPDPITNRTAIPPAAAKIHFQALNIDRRFDVKGDVVFTSPPADLDVTFLRIDGDPPAGPLTIYDGELQMSEPPPRLYIIGHPLGHDLEISLQDNYLLGFNERVVHYRTPTERGSSGSPVFEPGFWEVVALHHRGKANMPRLDNPQEAYDANEGISIKAIQKRTRGA